jgi:prepilin-type processing-associated H-X9-DG protein
LPRFRHAGTTNVGFCDGHAKTKSLGGILWYKNIYEAGSMPAPF